jgi:hypothetical protein
MPPYNRELSGSQVSSNELKKNFGNPCRINGESLGKGATLRTDQMKNNFGGIS